MPLYATTIQQGERLELRRKTHTKQRRKIAFLVGYTHDGARKRERDHAAADMIDRLYYYDDVGWRERDGGHII